MTQPEATQTRESLARFVAGQIADLTLTGEEQNALTRALVALTSRMDPDTTPETPSEG